MEKVRNCLEFLVCSKKSKFKKVRTISNFFFIFLHFFTSVFLPSGENMDLKTDFLVMCVTVTPGPYYLAVFPTKLLN